jgi:hypothetical protein
VTTTPEHTPLHGRRVTPPVTHGTGLSVAGHIGWRPATEDEQAAQASAYARQRERDAALVRVAPPIGPLPWEKP